MGGKGCACTLSPALAGKFDKYKHTCQDNAPVRREGGVLTISERWGDNLCCNTRVFSSGYLSRGESVLDICACSCLCLAWLITVLVPFAVLTQDPSQPKVLMSSCRGTCNVYHAVTCCSFPEACLYVTAVATRRCLIRRCAVR